MRVRGTASKERPIVAARRRRGNFINIARARDIMRIKTSSCTKISWEPGIKRMPALRYFQ